MGTKYCIVANVGMRHATRQNEYGTVLQYRR